MATIMLKSDMKNTHIKIENLPVVAVKQGDYYVYYSPVLEVSSYGESLELAEKRFTEAVGILFEELSTQGALADELAALGWTVNKKSGAYLPPVLVEAGAKDYEVSL